MGRRVHGGRLSQPSKMVKYLALLLVVATVFGEPEPSPSAVAEPSAESKADPYLLYGGYYGYGLRHLGYGGYYGYPYWGRKRRSAEPEPEPTAAADPNANADPNADPYLLYYGGLGHYGYRGRKRRSAEPEPEPKAEPNADPRYGYYGHGY